MSPKNEPVGTFSRSEMQEIAESARIIYQKTQIGSSLETSAESLLHRLESFVSRCTLESTPKPSAWQPMSTAPKDGTLVDVWVLKPADGGPPCRFADCSWTDGCGELGWNFSPDCQPVAWMLPPSGPHSEASQQAQETV